MRSRSVLSIFLVVLVVALSSCVAPSKKGRRHQVEQSSSEESYDLPAPRGSKLSSDEIFRRFNPAVIMIFTTNGEQAFQGSVFFINTTGLAVSNYHVFKGTGRGLEQIKLANSDVAHHVTKVVYYSEEEDVIIFQTDCKKTACLSIARKKPAVGAKVYAIGSPLGLENTISDGLVSQWRNDIVMQISVPIDHGSSGGALIDEYGNAVGITTGTFDENSGANLNVAVSTTVVLNHLQ